MSLPTYADVSEAAQRLRGIARELAEQGGLTVIPPFSHPDVMAGQGTAADERLVEVMRSLAATMKTVVETTGFLGMAGLIEQRERWRGRRVGVILSGGNVDMAHLARLMESDYGALCAPAELNRGARSEA